MPTTNLRRLLLSPTALARLLARPPRARQKVRHRKVRLDLNLLETRAVPSSPQGEDEEEEDGADWLNLDAIERMMDYYEQHGGAQQGGQPGATDGPVNDRLSDLTAQDTQSETTLLAFPSGGSTTVLVGYNDSGSFIGGRPQFTGLSRSTDGGATFVDQGALPLSPLGDVGDPVLARDNTSGTIYFATLQFNGSGIVVFRSFDGGATFTAPTQGAPGKDGFQDKEWLAVDNFAGPGQGNVYLAARDFGSGNGIYFFRSTDGGASFGPAGGTLIASGAFGNVQGAYVAVGTDHSVNAFWFDETSFPKRIMMRKSTDQGVTFGAPVTVAILGTAGGNGDLDLRGARQGDASPFYFRSNAFPQVVVNPVNGDLYATFADNPVGVDKADVKFTMSSDGGATWSTPTRVNDDATTNDQWQPTIAVTPNGSKVGVFWYDRRLDPGNNLIDYFGSVGSVSGHSVSFQPNIRVTTNSFLPEFGHDPVVNQVYMGDYDAAAADNGHFYVSWADNSNNSLADPGRKNADVQFAAIPLGLTVTSTSPAEGAILSTAPTQFVVNFTDAYDPATVQAGDLTVNGIPATSVALTDADTLTFTFATGPVTSQGVQTMSLAQGSILRLGDGDDVDAFTAHFRYDAVQLQVTATTPAAGSVVTLPLGTLRLTFNEPYDPASVGTNDITVSQGTVTGVNVINATTVEYVLSGLTQEGTLKVNLGAGAVTDIYGNPGAGFAASYSLDIGTVPFPTPLGAKLPAGSLIYDPAQSGIISPADDADSFSMLVDPGQKITVKVTLPQAPLYGGVGNGSFNAGALLRLDPATAAGTLVGDPVTPGGLSGLVFDPASGVLFGSTIRNVGNVSTLVRIDPATGALLSTIGVITDGPGGRGISIGDLALQPGTNTLYGIGSNAGGFGGRLYTIDKATGVATFVGHTGSGAGGGIAFAPDGSLYQTAFNSGFDFPSLNKVNPADATRISTVAIPGYFDGLAIRPTDGALFAAGGGSDDSVFLLNPATGALTFVGRTGAGSTSDLAFGAGPGLAPVIELRYQDGTLLGTASAAAGQDAILQTVATAGQIGGLSPGPRTYTATVRGAGGTTGAYTVQMILNAAVETEGHGGTANDTRATAQSLEPSFLPLNSSVNLVQTAPYPGRGAVLGRTDAGSPTPDYYSFALTAGESATLALTSLSSGNVTLALENAAGTTLAQGVPGADNVDAFISNFVAPAAGTYYVRVAGDPGTDYSLVVTRNADFNAEPNDSTATAQALIGNQVSGQRWAMGSVTGNTDLLDLRGTPVSGPLVLAGDKITLGINGDGSYVVGPTGIQFLGTEFVVPGTPLAGFTVGRDGANFTNKGAVGTTDIAVTKEDISSGSLHGVRIVGVVGGNLRLERVIAFRDGDEFATIVTRLTNLGGTTLNNVAWLENLDPDQGQPFTGDFSTANDVVLGGQLVRGTAFPPPFPNGLTIGLGSADARRVVSAEGFDNRDPFEIINSPQDPDGAFGDIAINVAFNYGTLAPSQAVSSLAIMTFGRSPAEADATYSAHTGGTSQRDTDFYRVTVNESQTLQVQTATPADQGGEFVNNLNPMVRVYNAAGALVASDDNSATDHRNAALSYKVPKGAGGTYYIEVLPSTATAQPTKGEYILSVKQATGALPPFQVTGTNPADGARLRASPTAITVDFNDALLLTTLQGSDLTVDGVPAASVTVLDGDTAAFTLAGVLPEGNHVVRIAAGAVGDVQNTPVRAFTSSFFLDLTPPRIVGVSLQEGDVVAPGDLTYVVHFSEPMRTANLSNSPFFLYGNVRGGSYTPDSASFDASGTTLTLHYTGLPEDNYTLTLFSGDGGFEDLIGWNLDGEPLAFPIPPNQTGDGFEGGNFFVDFSLDIETADYPTPLTPKAPLGSLIYDPSTTGVINFAGDTDSYTVRLDAGQTVTVTIDPASGLQPTLELRDPSNAVIAAATASGPGQPDAVIQTAPAVAAGTYKITVGGAAGTAGLYTLHATLNAAVEGESRGGPSNDTLPGAQDLTPSFTDLLNGATRGAVIGRTDPAGGYAASSVPFTFEDISATGQATLQFTDDSVNFLSAADLGGFQFTFFGQTYDSVFYSTNGLITFGSGSGQFGNSDLTFSPFQAAIAPFWDDLETFSTAGGAVYWQVVGSGAGQHLVIEWKDVHFFFGSPSTLTFEAVLNADGSIQFNYQDLVGGFFSDEGRSATVGVKDVGAPPPARLLLSFNDGPNQYVGTGQSTRIVPVPPPADLYSFHLDAGQSASAVAEALGGGDVHLELLDAGGNVVATGIGGSPLANGSFESGDFTGWATVTTGSPFVPWTVSPAGFGSGFFPPTSPQDGTFDAWNGFDGAGPMLYAMTQDVTIPAGAPVAQFSWQERIQWDFALTGTATQPRTYEVEVLDPNGNAVLATLYSFSTGVAHVVGDTGWQTHTVDLSAFTGTTVRLRFREDIPETFTGPGQIEFDGIGLNVGGPQNVDNAISNFVAPAAGTYYARVTGRPGTDYSVVVTRSAVFDLEDNNTIARAQPLGANPVALGYVGGPGDPSDFYAFSATPGQSLHLFTATPADGPGEFANSLNPHLRLYDPTGALVAEGVARPDGRNEDIQWTAAAAGTYTVEVSAEAGTSGEYVLDPSPTAGPRSALGPATTSTPPAASTSHGTFVGERGGVLTVRGDRGPNVIHIVDDGTGAPGNITVSADGVVRTSAGAITTVRIEAGGGGDTVDYVLAGNLLPFVRRDVRVNLGAGDDSFAASLNGALLEGARFDLRVAGGGGDDRIAVDAGFATVSDGASLGLALTGGAGRDEIDVRHYGTVRGSFRTSARGDAGDDHVSVALAGGNPGTVRASVAGGLGADDLGLRVDSAGLEELVGWVYGNAEDRIDATPGAVRIV